MQIKMSIFHITYFQNYFSYHLANVINVLFQVIPDFGIILHIYSEQNIFHGEMFLV